MVPWACLESHETQPRVWTSTLSPSGLNVGLSRSPQLNFTEPMKRDSAIVKCCGLRGFVESIEEASGGWTWGSVCPPGKGELTSILIHLDDVEISAPASTLSFSRKDIMLP